MRRAFIVVVASAFVVVFAFAFLVVIPTLSEAEGERTCFLPFFAPIPSQMRLQLAAIRCDR